MKINIPGLGELELTLEREFTENHDTILVYRDPDSFCCEYMEAPANTPHVEVWMRQETKRPDDEYGKLIGPMEVMKMMVGGKEINYA